MEFTVFTSAGGFREFLGESTYEVGKQNGCLYVVDGGSGQSVTYGANAWASIQVWQRDGQIVPPAGESRRELPEDETRDDAAELGTPTPEVMEALEVAVAEVPDVPADLGPLEEPQDPGPIEILEPSAHAAVGKPRRSRAATVSYEEAEPILVAAEPVAEPASDPVVETATPLEAEAAESSPPRQFDPLLDPIDTFAEPPTR